MQGVLLLAAPLVLAKAPAPKPLPTKPTAPAAAAAAPPAAAPSGQGRCVDADGRLPTAAPMPFADEAQGATAQQQALQQLVRDAVAHSKGLSAAELAALAAQDDIEETRSAKKIQATATAGFGPGGSSSLAGTELSPLQLRAGLSVGQLLYDGGRNDRMVDWRTQLAESARYGQLSAREQLVLNAVSLALERSRFRQHQLVYTQFVRKMSCIVEALELIITIDRGRGSELLQARKALQQAELSQAQSESALRQVEVRLRRLAGQLPPPQGLAALLLEVPRLDALMGEVEHSADIEALSAQARAAAAYAGSVKAATKPQVSWNLSATQALARSQVSGGDARTLNTGQYQLGVAVSVPLLSPGSDSANSAAARRARASALQRDEALEARRFRLSEVHEQARASFDRMRRLEQVLQNSDQVRAATLQQWQQLGRRSLFDVMSAESEHYNLRISYINALIDGQQLNANLLSLGRGVSEWLQ